MHYTLYRKQTKDSEFVVCLFCFSNACISVLAKMTKANYFFDLKNILSMKSS